MNNNFSGCSAPITCKELFASRFVLFSPERIRAIRHALRESREEFCERFFVEPDTIKCWEHEEGHKKHREISGPAARLMLACEVEALEKVGGRGASLKRIIERHHKSLTKRFEAAGRVRI